MEINLQSTRFSVFYYTFVILLGRQDRCLTQVFTSQSAVICNANFLPIIRYKLRIVIYQITASV